MKYLVPSVLSLAVFGAFGLTGDLRGPTTVLVFAIIGWLFKRYEYSVPAAVIGILLSPIAEDSMIYTYQISGGRPDYFLERPMAILILILLIISLFGKQVAERVKSRASQ